MGIHIFLIPKRFYYFDLSMLQDIVISLTLLKASVDCYKDTVIKLCCIILLPNNATHSYEH